jgi:hypothetical protein
MDLRNPLKRPENIPEKDFLNRQDRKENANPAWTDRQAFLSQVFERSANRVQFSFIDNQKSVMGFIKLLNVDFRVRTVVLFYRTSS